MSNTSTAHDAWLGWVKSPDGRGTIDIIWGCTLTTFLCVWTVLNLNVPAKDTTFWQFTRTKAKWMLIALWGPEWLLGVAGGQWLYAKLAVEEFKKAKIPWKMRQAFFAEMGGIKLRLKDHPDFPITSKHLLVLVRLELLKRDMLEETISTQAINDRSKADGVAKLFTILQTAWFMLTLVARLGQHLAITTLELSTAAFVVCTLGTNLLWWNKPKDILIPIIVYADCSLEVLVQKGVVKGLQLSGAKIAADSTQWICSPLEWFDDLRPNFLFDVMDKFRDVDRLQQTNLELRTSQQQQLKRFRNDRLPPFQRYSPLISFMMAVSLLFGAVYVAGWNIPFPTHVEQVIWQTCTVTLLSLIIAFWAVDWGQELVRRLSKAQAAKDVPAHFVYLLTPVALLYILVRAYLLGESLAGLRSLPPSAFSSIEWADYIPHI